MSRPVPAASCPVHPLATLLVALLASVSLLFASPVLAQSDEEKAEEKESDEEKAEEKESAAADESTDEAEEAAAEQGSKSSGTTGPPKSDQEARLQPLDPSLKEAPGPSGWPEGKPRGPGPEGGDSDTEGSGEGPRPDDGIGVGCQDYIDCVCAVADRSKGKTIGGYDHAGTCKVARTYTTPEYEELCASELDEVKDALEDAKEDYKAHGIKLPPACQ